MKLSELLKNVKYTTVQGGDPEISDLVYDSRKAARGTAFVCLKGYTSDGHKFAQSAVEKGASALVVSDVLDFEVPAEVAVIKTDDTRLALALMSVELFRHPERELKTIAITGTKGKTTTTAMIAEIFEHAGIKTGTIGTLGIVYGGNTYKTDNTTPESYEIQKAMRAMADAGCGAMVIEASSIGLKHSRLAGVTFDVGVFTNFSHDHIGGVEHKDMEEYLCFSVRSKTPPQTPTIPHTRKSPGISAARCSPSASPRTATCAPETTDSFRAADLSEFTSIAAAQGTSRSTSAFPEFSTYTTPWRQSAR